MPHCFASADQLARLQSQQGRSVWARGLADGDDEIRTTVGRALHAHYRAAVAPPWPLIEANVATDRAVRIRTRRPDPPTAP
ncbi:hypothetical protein [Actinoallomurus sp. CA-142502]